MKKQQELKIDHSNYLRIGSPGYHDLRAYVKLIEFDCSWSGTTGLDLSGCFNLVRLRCPGNNLISVDFLAKLPHPEKLEVLEIYDNNIQPTTLDFLRPFVNLKDCKLGENLDIMDRKKVLVQRM